AASPSRPPAGWPRPEPTSSPSAPGSGATPKGRPPRCGPSSRSWPPPPVRHSRDVRKLVLGCGGLKPFARIMITSRTLTIDDVPAGGRAAAGRPSRPHTSLFERPEAPIVAALLVAMLTVLALTTSRSAGLVAALWAPAGLAVAAWLRGGRSARYDWAFGGLLAAGFAAGNLLAGNTVVMTAMFTVANMIDVIAAVALVRRFVPRLDFNDARTTGRFLVLAAAVAPLPAAMFTAACLAAAGQSFTATFETWWFGHALSIAIIAPFILSLRRQTLATLRDPR